VGVTHRCTRLRMPLMLDVTRLRVNAIKDESNWSTMATSSQFATVVTVVSIHDAAECKGRT